MVLKDPKNSKDSKFNSIQNVKKKSIPKEKEKKKEIKSKITQKCGYTIGHGIEILPSKIPKAGLGLFATRAFKKNEIITFYDGPIIEYKEALRRRELKTDSHLRTLNVFCTCIDGITVPKKGLGGASFANDAKGILKMKGVVNNSKLVSKTHPTTQTTMVVLKALAPIQPKQEIFASYGRTYWLLLSKP